MKLKWLLPLLLITNAHAVGIGGGASHTFILNTPLSPYVTTSGTITNADTILTALEKIGGTSVFSVGATAPILSSGGQTPTLSCRQVNASQSGCLSATDWITFNNKLDASRFNYITNSDAEVDTTGWNLYNDTGNTTAAFVVDQDITYTSTLSGDSGNGATITYALGTGPYSEPPTITCPTGTSVLVKWYNGPTLAQNPTATVLKAAYDATPCAVAIATSAITGTASNRQYITGTVTLGDGGDTQPVNGTGGIPAGVTFIRSTSSPLVGAASFLYSKDAANREGQGVSTDFIINSADKGQPLQISFYYSGSAGMTLGTSSDARVFIYDITNAAFISVTPRKTLAGPVSTTKTFVGQFTASATSVSYRLILHISTASVTSWDLQLDSVVVNDVLNATAATQVPSVVLQSQPISGAVTDHMAVAWIDGAASWVPATSAYNGDYWSMQGFATNIIGLTADIYVHGYMDGFSFGPFVGYNQYVDTVTAGLLNPLPSPFTDTYLIMGKSVSSTAMNIQPFKGIDLIQTTGTPRKGGLLTNTGANDGTGDIAIAGGTTGQFARANTGVTAGLQFFTPVGTAPIVYTAATSAWSCTASSDSVAGCLSAADHTSLTADTAARHNAVTIGTANGLSLATQVLSLAAATDSVPGAMTAADHTSLTADTAAKHNAVTLAAIGATPNANGATLSTQVLNLQPASASFGGVMTTGAQTFAGVKTFASPVFTTQTTMPAINLINGATNGTNTVLVFKDGHIKSTITTAPTATVQAAAGTGSTCTVANATDAAGAITITSGTVGISTGDYCNVNFNKAYGVAPICVLTPANSTISTSVYVTSSTSVVSVNFAIAAGISSTYVLNYHCLETQ